jgi:hypothetical protein
MKIKVEVPKDGRSSILQNLVILFQITHLLHIPEDSNFHNHRRENLTIH